MVTTSKLEKIGEIIESGVESGLNRIDGVSYANNDLEI